MDKKVIIDMFMPSDNAEKKGVIEMLDRIKSNSKVESGFAAAAVWPSMTRWKAALDLQNADPDVLSELARDSAATGDAIVSPTDILGTLLFFLTAWETGVGLCGFLCRRGRCNARGEATGYQDRVFGSSTRA